MKTKQQILESFCAARDFSHFDTHPDLTRPWQYNGHTYASNRHWMVRMKTEGLPEYAQHDWKQASIGDWFANAPFDRLTPMQPITCPPCKNCNGSGWETATDCDRCKGKGCRRCDGEGAIFSPALHDAPGAKPCVCGGLGLDFSNDLIVPYMGGLFQTAYLSIISRLPGVAFAAAPESICDQYPMAAFAFDGAQGLLMPCLDRKACA